jgi:sugar (pentulose or hexulose) kinase
VKNPFANAGVLAVALSVQGEAVIPVDQDGKILRPTMLGIDTRTMITLDWRAAF